MLLMRNDELNKSSDASKTMWYRDSIEYILDELSLLDARLYLEILKEREKQPKELFEELKGLVLSEQEVFRLFQMNIESNYESREIQEAKEKLENIKANIEVKRNLTLEKGVFLSLPCFSEVFELTVFEEQCIILCLAIELDRKYEKVYAFLQDDLNCKKPTIDLCFKLFCNSVAEKIYFRKYFEKKNRLYKYFLEESNEESRKSFLSTSLKLEQGIVSLLLDSWEEDAVDYMEIFTPQLEINEMVVSKKIHESLCKYSDTTHHEGIKTAYYLFGSEGSGKRFQVKAFAKYKNNYCLFIDLKQIINEEKFEEFILKALRRASFLDCIISFENFEALLEDEEINYYKIEFMFKKLKEFKNEIFILSKKLWKSISFTKHLYLINIEIQPPADSERKDLWLYYGKNYKFDKNVNFDALINKFKFTPGQIENSLKMSKIYASWENEDTEISNENIIKACYSQVSHKLEKKSTLISPKYSFEDLILPKEAKLQIKNSINQIMYRHIVYGQWGFEKKLSYGKGLSMLFSGPPGTGKTMAAQVVAKELNLEIYKIDLSQVISKYIGETEKNLGEIFGEAKSSNAILFFDETDALFGKRSEVKDSHDKYSNIETSYLLQKMEEYEGITILATNFLQNIDEAFIRRINYIIKFPFPDEKHREMLWHNMFPKETPLDKDIDFKYLADKFKLAGGNIKNVVLSAAFMAVENLEPVGMKHILTAIKYELEKSGKVLFKQDILEYYDLVFPDG